jgi:hypothetical protein
MTNRPSVRLVSHPLTWEEAREESSQRVMRHRSAREVEYIAARRRRVFWRKVGRLVAVLLMLGGTALPHWDLRGALIVAEVCTLILVCWAVWLLYRFNGTVDDEGSVRGRR